VYAPQPRRRLSRGRFSFLPKRRAFLVRSHSRVIIAPFLSDLAVTVAAKLDRVPKNIEAIQSCVNTYSACCPARLIPDAHGKATLDRSIPPPVDIAVLIGESVYQMRSALDHLAFDLVKLNPSSVPLPADWEEKCQFPILTKPLKPGQVAPLPYGCFKNLPGISTQAHTFIERIQPYYGIGQVNNCLRLLSHLCNIDKHRHLALTRGRTQVSEVRTWASGNQSRSWMPLDHGAEIDKGCIIRV